MQALDYRGEFGILLHEFLDLARVQALHGALRLPEDQRILLFLIACARSELLYFGLDTAAL